MSKILIVEDDKDIAEMLSDYLNSENFEVEIANDGEEAISIYKASEYDLLLIDLMLPKLDGYELIKKIRNIDNVPIIIITSREEEMHKTKGLNIGADDYITKPFSLAELLARIRSNIRRATKYNKSNNRNGSYEDIIKVKDLEINISKHTVFRELLEINLTTTEFKILELFSSNLGRAFSKEQIYNIIWNEPYYGNEKVLNTHINRLRSKLNNDDNDIQYIKTIWGLGYKMEEN